MDRRWDERRLSAYVDFVVGVKAAYQRARRHLEDGTHPDPVNDEYVRDRMREENFKYEEVRLLGSKRVRGAAKSVHDAYRDAIKSRSIEDLSGIDELIQKFRNEVQMELNVK